MQPILNRLRRESTMGKTGNMCFPDPQALQVKLSLGIGFFKALGIIRKFGAVEGLVVADKSKFLKEMLDCKQAFPGMGI
jgi:hypothetical protein